MLQCPVSFTFLIRYKVIGPPAPPATDTNHHLLLSTQPWKPTIESWAQITFFNAFTWSFRLFFICEENNGENLPLACFLYPTDSGNTENVQTICCFC